MRINEIAPGERADVVKNRIASFIKIVRTECSDAWEAYHRNYTLLYRGVASAVGTNMFHSMPRENRRTLTSNPKLQTYIDNALAKTGFTALRSNSIFCTTEGVDAASYGKPFIIFPKNGFSFTWSPDVGDLFIELGKREISPGDLSNLSAVDIVGEFNYKNTNFDAALKSGNEIMIHGEYYACSSDKYEDAIIKYMP